MAGEARTDNFMLGTATLMLGPLARLMALGVDDSVGLVKNVKLMSEPSNAELTQGVRNSLVYSVLTGNPVTMSGEVYEYTLKNLMYSASLDGSALTTIAAAATTVASAYVAPVNPALLGAVTLPVTDATNIAQGDTIAVQVGARDQVFARRVVSKSTNTLTLDYGFPVAIAAGAPLKKVTVAAIGTQDEPPYLAAKLIGELANGQVVTVLVPKIKITSGLNLAFQTDNFQNMPWELKVYDQLPTDPFYADFATASPGGRLAKAKLIM